MSLLKGPVYLPLAFLSSASLLVSAISGMFLSFHYFYNQPLLSVLQLEAQVPLGCLLRNIHYFSSQIALISLFLHLLESIYKKFYLLKGKIAWFFLVLSFFILLFITFTGYLLRGDEVGELAGNIAENLLLSLPFLGEWINRIFLAISQIGLSRVYHWHIFLSFFLIFGLFIWHIKIKALLRWERIFYFLGVIIPVFFIQFPLKPFQGSIARGPWFFVGAQEMLKFLPPQLVFFWLLLPFILLQSYSFYPFKGINIFILLYLIIYIFFSILFFL